MDTSSVSPIVHGFDLNRSNSVFQWIKLKIGKRNECPWCQAVLPNIESIKQLIEPATNNTNNNSNNGQGVVLIEDQLVGRVPNIQFLVSIPHCPQLDWTFKYDNEDRSRNALVTSFLYIATVILPAVYLLSKYGSERLRHWHTQFPLRRPYPRGFLPKTTIVNQWLELRYALDQPTNNHSNQLDLSHLDEHDLDMFFYWINSVPQQNDSKEATHTKSELFKNIAHNDKLIQQLLHVQDERLAATWKLLKQTQSDPQ